MLMISALCSTPGHVDKFRSIFHLIILIHIFPLGKKKNGCLPFLDVNIFGENRKFTTIIYQKRPSVG